MCALDIRPCVATERLILRAPVAADAPAIAELANDRAVAAMTSTWPFPCGVEDVEAKLAALAAPGDQDRRADFVIEHRQFGVVGMLGFGESTPRRLELGYWLGRPFWGRGYATEAVRAALRWAGADWRKNVVWAGHFADNPASGEVLCKAGFLYTGEVVQLASLARGGATAPARMMVWLA